MHSAYVVRDSRGRSPYWYAVFVDPSGRRLKKSTGLTAKSKALEMARALQKASDEGRQAMLTEVRARELLGQVLQTANGEKLRVFTVAEWFDHFVKGKCKSKSDATARRHEQTRREFMDFLGARARLNVAAITAKDILDFRDSREAKGLSPATLNLDITILSAAFNGALRQGLIPVNRCVGIEPLRNKGAGKADFTLEQIRALLQVASGEWRGLILTAFYTGQRLGDCATLRFGDIDLVSEIKTIRWSQSQDKKAADITVIHPELEKYLLSLPSSDDEKAFVFPELAERPVNTLSTIFAGIMREARIENRVVREKTEGGHTVRALSFHSLRHSFNSILANAGVGEEMRMALSGHKSRDINKRYTHRDLAPLREAMSLLPSV